MSFVSIGGMQLKRWTSYFRIIGPTMRVLRAAKQNPACLHAATFKAGDVFFAVSVWKDRKHMQEFAKSGLHGQLSALAMERMALFYNHSEPVTGVPEREQLVSLWQAAIKARDGRGTVGTYHG